MSAHTPHYTPPRYQVVLFYMLVTSIVLMGIFLFLEHRRVQRRLTAANDRTPLTAPVAAAASESFILDRASDADGTITASTRQLALPPEPSVRARALLDRLLAEDALPGSPHPLASGSAVADVFLLDLPLQNPAEPPPPSAAAPDSPSNQLAVVNLRGTFVDHHPSGVEVETLTLLSILGTLHANFPQIAQVRFLVDGQPHDTLAGHASLDRTYPATDTTLTAAQTHPDSSDDSTDSTNTDQP